MNDKTEELRDIFVSVTDEDTVTESQEEGHGSLASDEEVDERLESTIVSMRENLGFETSLDDDARATLVRRFYAGDSDSEIASQLDVDEETVTRTRLDLHLLRDEDTDAPFDLDVLREYDDASAAADDLDAAESELERYQRVLDTQDEVQRLNDRYRAEFENVLRDRELSERLTSDVHEDGLDEATEGQETDIDI